MNYLKGWHRIKENKLKLLLLIIGQLLFFILIAFINVKYQLELAESANELIAPLQDANYNAESIKSGVPFLENIGKIYETYERIVSALKKLIAFQLAAFLTLGIALWTLAHHIVENKSFKQLTQSYADLLARAIIFILPLFIIIYILIQQAFEHAFAGTEQTIDTVYIAVGIFFIGMYFMIISLSQKKSNVIDMSEINKRHVSGFSPRNNNLISDHAQELTGFSKSVLDNTKHAFFLGIKKIHYTLSTIIVIAAFAALSGYGVYMLLEQSLWLLAPAIILLAVVVALGKIAMITIVENIDIVNDTNKL